MDEPVSDPSAPEADAAAAPAEPVEPVRGLARFEQLPLFVRLLPSLALMAGVALTILLLYPDAFVRATQLAVLYVVTPLGQEAWLVFGHNPPFNFTYRFVALFLWSVGFAQVLFLVALPVDKLIAKLGWVGRRVARFEAKVRRSRFASRGLVVALAIVVALPIHFGGGIVGSLAGRVMGLRWHEVLFAVMAAITLRYILALAAVLGVTSLWGGG